MNANTKAVVKANRTRTLEPPLAPLDPNQRYTMDETERYLRLSRPELYKQIAAGHLKTIMDGRRRYTQGREIIRKSSESRPLCARLADGSLRGVRAANAARSGS
jgi:hypothetical protein